MKIAQVVCAFPPYKGGIGNAVHHFSRELAGRGHEITVFTPRYSNQPAQPQHEQYDFEVVRLKPLASRGLAAILPQLLRRLKGFDIIHLHYPFYGSAGLVALVRLLRPSTKVALYYHMDTRAGGLKGAVFRLYRFLILPILLHIAGEITCSSFDFIMNSDAGRYFKRHPDKFDEVPYGVDTELFVPGPDPRQGKARVVQFVGALIKQGYFKGVENLISAHKLVTRELDGCMLRIIGSGDKEESYRELTARLGISENVEFINDADDSRLIECYQSCDLVVLPSLDTSEAFGIVLLEGMACGKPVIASDLPGVRSVFENDQQGLLAEPGNIEDLADKIITLLSDREMARRLGGAGRERVEASYTWTRAGESLEVIYEKVNRDR
jgi:glycosyltransferase involved in cell wall biosynthesis